MVNRTGPKHKVQKQKFIFQVLLEKFRNSLLVVLQKMEELVAGGQGDSEALAHQRTRKAVAEPSKRRLRV